MEVFELIHSPFEGNTDLNQKNSVAPKKNIRIQIPNSSLLLEFILDQNAFFQRHLKAHC